MSGKFLGFRNFLVTSFVVLCKNLIMYFVLLVSLLFISARSTISLCPKMVYIRDSPIWKYWVEVLDSVAFLKKLFDGLTRVMSNLCKTLYLITYY